MIVVVGEDSDAGVSPIQDVIDAAAFRNAWWSLHPPRLTQEEPDV